MSEIAREIRYLRRMGIVLTILTCLLLVVLGIYAWPLIRARFFPGAPGRAITPRGPLMSFENVAIDVAKKAGPSVAYITTDTRALNRRTRAVEDVPQGAGSGFIWDEQGHIVTNFHVIENASAAHVVLHDQTTYDAQLIGTDPSHDLAVLQIKVPLGVRLTPISLGSSNDLQVGQSAYAIGNPFGLDKTMTEGIVSALNRTIPGAGGKDIDEAIQISTVINPGSSGGPLLDSDGRLIGVTTAIYSPSGAWSGVGFAIPVDLANQVVPKIIAAGRRAQLAINFDDSIPLPNNLEGLPITAVQPNSTAATAGLIAASQVPAARGGRFPRFTLGDIIIQIDGQPIKNSADLFDILNKHAPGDTVEMTLWNNGNVRRIRVQTQ